MMKSDLLLFFLWEAAEHTGEALLHFLWQGALIGLGVALLLQVVGHRRAPLRYGIACGGLFLMATSFALTLLRHWPSPMGVATTPAVSGAPRLLSGGPGAEVAMAGTFPVTAFSWLTAAWLVGVIALTFFHWVGWLAGWRLRLKRHLNPAPQRVVDCLEGLQTTMGIARKVTVALSSKVSIPCVIGAFRPVILLPVAALTGLSQSQLQALLAHELAHIRRHDYLVNWLQAFVETLLFFHPAVWWIGQRIREEREHCCDDEAVRVAGDLRGYAEALLAMESIRQKIPQGAMAVSGADSSGLLERIRRLVKPDDPRPVVRYRCSGAVFLAGMVAFLVIWSSWGLRADERGRGKGSEVGEAQDTGLGNGEVSEALPDQPIAGSGQEPPVQLLEGVTGEDRIVRALTLFPGNVILAEIGPRWISGTMDLQEMRASGYGDQHPRVAAKVSKLKSLKELLDQAIETEIQTEHTRNWLEIQPSPGEDEGKRRALVSEIEALDREKTDLSRRYLPKHPKMISTQRKLDQAKRKLAAFEGSDAGQEEIRLREEMVALRERAVRVAQRNLQAGDADTSPQEVQELRLQLLRSRTDLAKARGLRKDMVKLSEEEVEISESRLRSARKRYYAEGELSLAELMRIEASLLEARLRLEQVKAELKPLAPIERVERIRFQVSEKNEILFEKRVVSIKEVASIIGPLMARNPALDLIIEGHPDALHGSVVALHMEVTRLGVKKISVASKPD
ncbi:MAG: M56 family metallopeptidase [Verrucomicrobiota bacterium]